MNDAQIDAAARWAKSLQRYAAVDTLNLRTADDGSDEPFIFAELRGKPHGHAEVTIAPDGTVRTLTGQEVTTGG